MRIIQKQMNWRLRIKCEQESDKERPENAEALFILLILLPGFLTIKIKEFFIAKPKPDIMDRIMESLSYSVVSLI